MSIIAQWKGFSQEFLIEAGFENDFYPFENPMIYNQVSNARCEYKNIGYLGVGKINKHTDSNYYLPFSAFLVLRNDGFIAKGGSQSKLNYEPQHLGTIIVMNIHAIHHVIPDKRITTSSNIPCWIGACLEYDKKPNNHEVEETFRQFLNSRLGNS